MAIDPDEGGNEFPGLLKSLDDLLYEVVSWLVFYPMTFWRTLRHPRQKMACAGTELHDAAADQYQDTLRPPLFLLLTILLGHEIEIALIGQSSIITDKVGRAGLISDDTNLILLRLGIFGSVPLVLSVRMLRRRGHKVDRETLKMPFYSQCFAAAAFADSKFASAALYLPPLHPTVTNESITRFRPALSKSISSLLPSISAIAP